MRFALMLLVVAASVACQQTSSDSHDSKPNAQTVGRPSSAPAGGSQPVSGTTPISGLIGLASDMSPDSVKTSDVLFVMARASVDGRPGPLVAVKRIGGLDASRFPVRFELTEGDVMMTGVPFSGPFVVYARLDRDGDAMSKTPDDLYATYEGLAQNGDQNLKLTLKKAAQRPSAAPTSQPASAPAAPASRRTQPPKAPKK